MATSSRDLTGTKFGRLTVIAQTDKRSSSGEILWECACDCGGSATVVSSKLSGGRKRSCGCLELERSREGNVTHGAARHGQETRTYRSWHAAKVRCFTPTTHYYARYGGRGITMCDRWRDSFEAFLRDMGERPEGTTLDRIDSNGNYEPGNCRWATAKQQAGNRRKKK